MRDQKENVECSQEVLIEFVCNVCEGLLDEERFVCLAEVDFARDVCSVPHYGRIKSKIPCVDCRLNDQYIYDEHELNGDYDD